MSHFLNQTGMTLRERLKKHVGFQVAVRAAGAERVAGGLLNVGKQFIKVDQTYYAPSALEEITLLGYEPEQEGITARLRTFSRGAMNATLLQTGADFAEVLAESRNGGETEWLLIPFNQIISMERA